MCLTVFLKTSKYEKEVYSNSKTYTLIEPTIDIRLIWKIADDLLRNIFKDSFLYSKVGIILSDFYDKKNIQKSLIDYKSISETKEIKLMKTIDNINDRFGYGKIRLSSDNNQNFFSNSIVRNRKSPSWQMKTKYCSPCYTTRWCDIPKVKV